MNEEIRKILDKEAKVAELDKKDNKKTIYSVCNFGKFEGFNKIEVVGKFNDKINNDTLVNFAFMIKDKIQIVPQIVIVCPDGKDT